MTKPNLKTIVQSLDHNAAEKISKSFHYLAQASYGMDALMKADAIAREIEVLLRRIDSYTIQSLSGSVSDEDRAYKNMEVQNAVNEINRVASAIAQTSFTVQIASNYQGEVHISIPFMSTTYLFREDYGDFAGIAIDTLAHANSTRFFVDNAINRLSEARTTITEQVYNMENVVLGESARILRNLGVDDSEC